MMSSGNGEYIQLKKKNFFIHDARLHFHSSPITHTHMLSVTSKCASDDFKSEIHICCHVLSMPIYAVAANYHFVCRSPMSVFIDLERRKEKSDRTPSMRMHVFHRIATLHFVFYSETKSTSRVRKKKFIDIAPV